MPAVYEDFPARAVITDMDVLGIDNEKVTAWLADLLPGLKPPLAFSLLAGGNSNLSYKCVDQTGAAYVLRRPPLGHVLESAHDMVREHRIVSAMQQSSSVPVAPTHGACADVGVTGAPFYVMSYVEGVVVTEVEIARQLPMADRASLSKHLIDVLAALHHTDIDAIGLGDLARKEAYLARQLKRWTKQWQATKTHDIPEMDEAVRLLGDRMPDQVGASIVHGDYRLQNLIVAEGKIQAVLDWELCTLGDPLADLGYLLNNWAEPGEPNSEKNVIGIGGFYSRDELCDAYATATGRDLSHINYYRAFSSWRMAAINQGVYKRYLAGALGDDVGDIDLEDRKRRVRVRARIALDQLAG